MVEACRKKAVEAENTLDKIQLKESERVEEFMGERYVASARLHEVVTSLRRITKALKEEGQGSRYSNQGQEALRANSSQRNGSSCVLGI